MVQCSDVFMILRFHTNRITWNEMINEDARLPFFDWLILILDQSWTNNHLFMALMNPHIQYFVGGGEVQSLYMYSLTFSMYTFYPLHRAPHRIVLPSLQIITFASHHTHTHSTSAWYRFQHLIVIDPFILDCRLMEVEVEVEVEREEAQRRVLGHCIYPWPPNMHIPSVWVRRMGRNGVISCI